MRRITHRTRGQGHGPIVRLMSPSDLGQALEPFVFLDLFELPMRSRGGGGGMPLHPHSGIATITDPVGGKDFGGHRWNGGHLTPARERGARG